MTVLAQSTEELYKKYYLLAPRPVGMGSAFVAVADDVNALFWNSAGLAQIRDTHISVAHKFLDSL